MKNKHKDIHDFLVLNGFKEIKNDVFENKSCIVTIEIDTYTVKDATGGSVYSENLSIYWLIGFLTYYGFINKNYKNLNEK